MSIVATAHPNIALVKYWGKRGDTPEERALNLPAVGSLSLTVGGLTTTTSAEIIDAHEDRIHLGGAPATGGERARIVTFIDRARRMAGTDQRVAIDSTNSFPTAAGLASSASGFAALAMALRALWDLPLTLQGLSALARQGSGSAARSLHGGWVQWNRGEAADGSDSIAVPLAPPSWWDVRLVVAVLSRGPKAVGSRDGMAQSQRTSSTFRSFVDAQETDLAAARDALHRRDLPALGAVMEGSCLRMVSTWLTTRPPLHYWQPETLAVIQAVTSWRAEDGLPVWFTTDAGPQVKALTDAAHAEEVAARLRALPAVLDVLVCPVGGPATVRSP